MAPEQGSDDDDDRRIAPRPFKLSARLAYVRRTSHVVSCRGARHATPTDDSAQSRPGVSIYSRTPARSPEPARLTKQPSKKIKIQELVTAHQEPSLERVRRAKRRSEGTCQCHGLECSSSQQGWLARSLCGCWGRSPRVDACRRRRRRLLPMRKTRGATAEMMALARLRASATVDESRRRGGEIAARSPARRRPSCACSWTSTLRRDVRTYNVRGTVS